MPSLLQISYICPPVLLRHASASSSPPAAALLSRRTLRSVAFPSSTSSYPYSRSPCGSCSASGGRDRGCLASLAMDYPYLSPPHTDLMVDLLSALQDRLGPHLLPSSVPPDVLSFQNDSGTCKGALDIHSGAEGSTVDFILKSWLHCELPFGALDITTLLVFLSSETDAPHLLLEFIQNRPSSLILVMDLLPRRDLVLYPDYLDEFYQHTTLENVRKGLEEASEVSPYVSPSLQFRSMLSPTAILVNVNCGSEGASSMDDMMRDRIAAAAKEITSVWLDKCACCERKVAEGDRAGLLKRDKIIKRSAVEIDLVSNLPRLFGPDVAARLLAAIQSAFRV